MLGPGGAPRPDGSAGPRRAGDGAVVAVREAMALDREKALKDAERLLQQGRADEGLRVLERAAKSNPADLPALNRMGDLLARVGRRDEAIGYYEQIAARFGQSGFLPKAVAMYKKILRLDPDRTESLYRLGELYVRQKLPREARAHLLRAAERFLEAREYARGREAYEKLVAAEPDDPRHRVRLAESRAAAGETAEAAEELVRVAAELQKSGEIDQAEMTYQRAAELSPAEAEPMIGVAACLKSRASVDEAIRYLEERCAGDSPDPAVLGELACYYQEAGRSEDARKTLLGGAAAEIRPESFEKLFSLCREQGTVDALWAEVDLLFAGWTNDGEQARVLSLLERLSRLESDGHIPALRRMLDLFEGLGDATGISNAARRLIRAYEAKSMDAEAEEVGRRLRELGGEPADRPAPAVPASGGAENGVVALESAGREATEDVEDVDRLAAEAPAIPLNRSDEEFVNGRLTQAEILGKYGLADQALDQLVEIVQRFPGHLATQERLAKLYRSRHATQKLGETLVALALAKRAAGDTEGAQASAREAAEADVLSTTTRAVLERFSLLEPATRAAAAQHGGRERVTQSAGRPEGDEVVIDFDPGDVEEDVGAARTGAAGPAEVEQAAASRDHAVPPPPGLDDDDDLSAITAALEGELETSGGPDSPAAESEESLEEVFAAFKRHVQEQVDSEDFATHYDLGIAYKEMGLLDEAIAEFTIAAGSTERHCEAFSMLALCHKEKGEMAEAAGWYRKALDAPDVDDQVQWGLRYDLADLLLLTGDAETALNLFRDVLQSDPSYRDVKSRVSELEHRLRS